MKANIPAQIWSILGWRSNQLHYKISSKTWQHQNTFWQKDLSVAHFDCSFQLYNLLSSKQPDATTLFFLGTPNEPSSPAT